MNVVGEPAEGGEGLERGGEGLGTRRGQEEGGEKVSREEERVWAGRESLGLGERWKGE